MPIWLHTLFTVIRIPVLGFVAVVGACGGLLFSNLNNPAPSGWFWLALFTLLFAAPVASIKLGEQLARRLPARCRKCGGRAYWNRVKAIEYRCRDCGRTHDTGWRGTRRRHRP